MKNIQSINILFGLMVVAFALQSCANIDIVKRKHRPGFHIDVKGNKQKKNVAEVEPHRVENAPESVATKSPEPFKKLEIEQPLIHRAVATTSAELDVQERNPVQSKLVELLRTNYPKVKRQKLNHELRRAVFNKDEEEKYGWSIVSFISAGLSVFALGFFITGIILLVSFIFAGGFAFWWIFALLGLVFGIGAMVTGIIGLRQTGRGEKRGRGFAIAGMVGGIVSLAGALISMFWGLIYSVINGFSGNDL